MPATISDRTNIKISGTLLHEDADRLILSGLEHNDLGIFQDKIGICCI